MTHLSKVWIMLQRHTFTSTYSATAYLMIIIEKANSPGTIRTYECSSQSAVPSHLATGLNNKRHFWCENSDSNREFKLRVFTSYPFDNSYFLFIFAVCLFKTFLRFELRFIGLQPICPSYQTKRSKIRNKLLSAGLANRDQVPVSELGQLSEE